MLVRSGIAAALMLALAACGGAAEDEPGNDGVSAKAAAAGSDIKLDPGQWEMTYEVTDVDAPGLPAGAMAAMAGKKNLMSLCITPAEANRPNGEIFSVQKGADCTRDGFEMAGGRISGTMTCSGGETAGKVTMAMDGRYSGQSYEMTNKMTTETEGMRMTISSRASGRRTGDCAAGDKG